MADTKRIWWVVLAVVLAAGAGVAARLLVGPPGSATDGSSTGQESTLESDAGDEGPRLQDADLYFPSAGGGLKLHRQALPAGEPLERVEHLVRALIKGPEGAVEGELYPPLPEGAALASVYRLDNGVVALDLRSQALEPPEAPESGEGAVEGAPRSAAPAVPKKALALGTRDELLAVYSLVNTVTLNQIEGVDRVVLLWDGQQPIAFAGHLDVSRPLIADTSWVMSSP